MTRTLEHGTPESYDAGCTSNDDCPAYAVHGMSCETAHFRFISGERRYMQFRGRNTPPAVIARRLGFEPKSTVKRIDPVELQARMAFPKLFAAADDLLEAHASITPPHPTDLEEVTTQEEPVMSTPSPATIAAKTPRKPSAGPSQSDVREWAHANGVEVNQRGTIRRDVVDAYLAAQQRATVKPLEIEEAVEIALSEVPDEISEDNTGFDEAAAAFVPEEAPAVPELPTSVADLVSEEVRILAAAEARLLAAVRAEPAEATAPVRTLAEWIDIRRELRHVIQGNSLAISETEAHKIAEAILLQGWEKVGAA